MSDSPLAVLPMYDLPEVRAETDRLWTALRDSLRDRGVPAPEALDRERAPLAAWTSPALVLGQTCGLPYITALADRVTLLGAPDYGVEGCPPGFYCSVLVVRADDPRDRLEGFRGARAAINEPGSQSGTAALFHAAAPFARDGRFFAGCTPTGSHRASAAAVAEGRADIAALDAVSWRLLCRHDARAARLRVLARTPPTPALPFITARGNDSETAAAAAGEAIAALDGSTSEALGMRGFVRFDRHAYQCLADRLAGTERVLALPR